MSTVVGLFVAPQNRRRDRTAREIIGVLASWQCRESRITISFIKELGRLVRLGKEMFLFYIHMEIIAFSDH